MAYFVISNDREDAKEKKELRSRAEQLLLGDTSIEGRRLLASLHYVRGEFGDAIRIWKSILTRTAEDKRKGLAIPTPIEKKKLYNNIALAYLQKEQPNIALANASKGIQECWNQIHESDRTEQVRILATKVLCLLALGDGPRALIEFNNRQELITQGRTTGSYLIETMIQTRLWENASESPIAKPMVCGPCGRFAGSLLSLQFGETYHLIR